MIFKNIKSHKCCVNYTNIKNIDNTQNVTCIGSSWYASNIGYGCCIKKKKNKSKIDESYGKTKKKVNNNNNNYNDDNNLFDDDARSIKKN